MFQNSPKKEKPYVASKLATAKYVSEHLYPGGDVPAATVIRDSVQTTVEDVLWLDRITAEDEKYRQDLAAAEAEAEMQSLLDGSTITMSPTASVKSKGAASLLGVGGTGGRRRLERCMICTLPLGACEHTEDWMLEFETQKYLEEDYKSALDSEIDSALDVVGGNDSGLETMCTDMDVGDLDLENMRWSTLNELQTDKIGASNMALFPPDDRFWHSSVCLDEKFLIVFGGFKYRGKGPFKPFKTIADPNEIDFLNDLRVYDVMNRSWYGVRGQGFLPPVNVHMVRPAVPESVVRFKLPPGRYGHSAAAIGKDRMLIFGGRGQNGRIFNDTWIYSMTTDLWTEIVHSHILPLPAPRFFAAACSKPDTQQVYLFGGTNGAENFGDLWKFDGIEPPLRRREEEEEREKDVMNVSLSSVSGDVSFKKDSGNTIGAPMMGSVIGMETVLNGGPKTIIGPATISGDYEHRGKEYLCWTRAVAVGLPPSPRYGHQMVLCEPPINAPLSPSTNSPPRGSKNEDRDRPGAGVSMIVLGGCAVSPQSEVVGSNFTPEETLQLMTISSELTKAYERESQTAILGRQKLQVTFEQGDAIDPHGNRVALTDNVLDIIQQSSTLSGLLHLREKDTRKAEQEMVDAYKLAKSQVAYNAKRARHPNPYLDVFFYDIKHERWSTKKFPKLTGSPSLPKSRIHFSASCIGGKYVFVLGGCHPTSTDSRLVDEITDSSGKNSGKINNSELYVFDIARNKWLKPLPVNSKEYLKESLKMAEVDMIRARDKCAAEVSRSLALGAPAGITKESALAESLYNVTKWRYEMLKKEGDEAAQSPIACYGATLTAIRQRVVFIGGWSIEEKIRKGILVLEMENEQEKQRRLQEELHARLEKERVAADIKSTMEELVSAHELREQRLNEKAKEEREQRLMSIQDFMSSLPPLSQPAPIKLVKSNRHTIWVKWDRNLRDTKKQMVDKEQVTYFLYIKTSYQNFLVGDRVLVTEKEALVKLADTISPTLRSTNLAPPPSSTLSTSTKGGAGGSTTTAGISANDIATALTPTNLSSEAFNSLFFDTKWRRFSGEILRVRPGGMFDILFDDGTSETKVPRCRIMHNPNALPPTSGHGRNGGQSYGGNNSIVSASFSTASTANGGGMGTISSRTHTSNSVESVRSLLSTNAFSISVRKRLKWKLHSLEKQRDSVKKIYHVQSKKHPMPLVKTMSFDDGSMTGGERELASVLEEEEEQWEREREKGGFGFSTGIGFGSSSYDEDSMTLGSSFSSLSPLRAHSHGYQHPPVPTVQPDDTWHLVYVGKDSSYACTGLVPRTVLEDEPCYRCAVTFCLQTHGLDYPEYERSQLSRPVILLTQAAPMEELVKLEATLSAPPPMVSVPITAHLQAPDSEVSANEETVTIGGVTMSRTKKEIITAVIKGQQMVSIEKRDHFYYATGQGEDYI